MLEYEAFTLDKETQADSVFQQKFIAASKQQLSGYL